MDARSRQDGARVQGPDANHFVCAGCLWIAAILIRCCAIRLRVEPATVIWLAYLTVTECGCATLRP